MWLLLQCYLVCAVVCALALAFVVWRDEGIAQLRADVLKIVMWSLVWPYVVYAIVRGKGP